jgi:hypothetical protein
MFRAGSFFFVSSRLILSSILLMSATFAHAQRHGAHGTGGSGTSGPEGVDEKDTLKDFHQALAVQATSRQIADFQDMVKITHAAKDTLDSLVNDDRKGAREGVTVFDHSWEAARRANKKFQDGFSEAQKSGLKEVTKRLERADSEIEQEAKRLHLVIQAESAQPELSAHATSLDKALTDFLNQQLALGREMGITLASGEDLVFNLPAIKNPANIGKRTILIGFSGSLSQTAAQGDLRTFQLESAIDLSDLQHNVTEVVSAEFSQASACGERLAVQRATILPAPPASSLILQLHFERWSCSRVSTELAEGDGSVELRLTPSVDKSVLNLTAEFKRIDATGMMAQELHSGDLGDDLRGKVAKTILSAVQAGADFKATLPGTIQGAILQSAHFEDSGGGSLRLVLQGQVQISNQQVNVLASQLNQALSPSGSPAQ